MDTLPIGKYISLIIDLFLLKIELCGHSPVWTFAPGEVEATPPNPRTSGGRPLPVFFLLRLTNSRRGEHKAPAGPRPMCCLVPRASPGALAWPRWPFGKG